MPASMARAALVADLKASLIDSAGAFRAADDADFIRHLDKAAQAFTPHRPRTEIGEITLTADQPEYAAPVDLWRFKSLIWGTKRSQPWERNWPGRLPEVRIAGGMMLLLPAPTAHQIAVLGATCRFFYAASPVIAEDGAQTTLNEADRALLLLRAQVVAMQELAMRDAVRPQSVRDGFSGTPKTGTPGWLAESFLREWERRIAA